MTADTARAALFAHLKSGTTSVCRVWAITRRDGVTLGFTDHDCTLSFEGIVFQASSGLTARVLRQTTGLAVDNSEVMGALSDVAIRDADILAGRYDGAEVRCWLVNWADPAERTMLFRGSLGEVARGEGAFHAELRGLTEALNQPQGLTYQKRCTAVLGDRRCGFPVANAGFHVVRTVEEIENRRVFRFADFTDVDDRWLEKGRAVILSGAAAGLFGVIKNDRISGTAREIELWDGLGADILPGDSVRFEAGCNKLPETCQLKFNNFNNFRGFPHIPGEDWMMSYPARSGVNDGGSLQG